MYNGYNPQQISTWDKLSGTTPLSAAGSVRTASAVVLLSDIVFISDNTLDARECPKGSQ